MAATFRQPFDRIAETSTAARRAKTGGAAKLPKTKSWLGNLDSNQD